MIQINNNYYIIIHYYVGLSVKCCGPQNGINIKTSAQETVFYSMHNKYLQLVHYTKVKDITYLYHMDRFSCGFLP